MGKNACALWFILYTLRELLKFVDTHADDKKTPKDLMLAFAKKLLAMDPSDLVRKPTEMFLRTAIRSFPYHNSLLFQTLAKSVAKVEFGQLPTTYMLLLQGLYGVRYVETSRFCATCGISSATKQCPKCKLPYCSADCQRFDWPIHKKCCEAISKRPLPGGDTATYIELNEDKLKDVKIED
uniref:MYND-type domain-containing protein n=1 Tax=Panagrellus redivivus TaxID=6233 RepID=A0A7E4ZQP2_PANRE